MRHFSTPLPIDDALDALLESLTVRSNLVLVAPPGAGKTTRVPLVLLDADWAAGGKIILLEPRRLAARAAAARMAAALGESVGETVGLRVRLESRVSAKTRIEVVTEGVFARMILDDPELGGVAAVLFDEFHERSLDADFGLALALDAQEGLREDLRLLVMSATLDGARVAGLLGGAPVVESLGRAFPVETVYLGRDPAERLDDAMARAILRGLGEQSGSILAFLPGQGEIQRVAGALAGRVPATVDIAPLYGALDRRAQDLAIEPAAAGRRKIVLATSIAETSLTIQGVRIVVDSGFARVPRFEPGLGLTRLETVRASQASADQRRGRAGRTEPGVCYRLWDEAGAGALPRFTSPEILSADLTGLVLDLAFWGARNPLALAWLDPPPSAAWTEARALLMRIGALDGDGAITEEGKAVRRLALPPRLARMVIASARAGAEAEAAVVALLLSERGLGGPSADLAHRAALLARELSARADAGRNLARAWAKQAREAVGKQTGRAEMSAGALVALAYPDRIAKARGRAGEFLMASGRAAALDPADSLSSSPFLAIAEVSGKAAHSRILAAAAISLGEIEALPGIVIEELDETRFETASAALRRRRTRRLGAIVLAEHSLPVEDSTVSADALAAGIAKLGIGRLPWTPPQKQRRARAAFLREGEPLVWPDLSDAGLAASDGAALAPFLAGRGSLAEIKPSDLDALLTAFLPFELARRLDTEAPAFFATPAGSEIAIDYESEGGPFLDVRVQELFGLADHPSVAKGRLPLTLRLLSPAHRPIQITRDLPGFWRGSWAAVRADMRGRYPRHPWPEDPAGALPTRRAKPRGT